MACVLAGSGRVPLTPTRKPSHGISLYPKKTFFILTVNPASISLSKTIPRSLTWSAKEPDVAVATSST